ncbi:max-like protein X [Parasteatoda tepidariorum]|nr:max-like protein X [Parasteatoda tepidariorum]XP_015913517.1 max-like protein X [Parasteatoda tepidariorum]XP_042895983.1 max-like protein X [Parasteatoda tepidariorum]
MAELHYTDSKFDPGSENEKRNLPSSPGPSLNFSFSRTSSTGSIDLLTSSSAHNTDDEDSDQKSTLSYKERRREAHTQAEQKRRDAIKRGYEDLQSLVPTCQQQDSISSYKLSKATILQRSIDYIQFLIQQKKKQDEELVALRKEVRALEIMKTNYEAIVKVHQSQPSSNSNKVSDEMKFQVFQAVCDSLFQSFNSSVSVANFAELSACVFSWLEEYCKPQTLQEMMINLLCQLNNQIT